MSGASDTTTDGDGRDATIRSFVSVIEATADGDLGQRMDETVEDDALAELARAYNELVEDWGDRFSDVDEFGSQVVTATEQVTSRVDSTQEASREVSQGIDEISDGVSEQNEFIQDISAEMRDLSATIEEIASSADEVVEAATRARERGETGREAAGAAISELHDLEDRTADTVENVEHLNDLMSEIRDVAAFIDDIAEQTNILALNANIEAARAGQAGEGFAVVADEVKELAEETQAATDEIETSIGRVRDQAERAVDDIHETRSSVTDGVETVEEALAALEEIADEVDEVHASIREISEGTDTQAESTQEVVQMVDEVEAISEETAAEAETVATAAQQQATSLTEIRTSITTLSERAEDLQTLLSAVETTGGTVGEVGSDATTVEFWHAMSGEKALLLDELAREFEAETDRSVVFDLTSKGSYRDTLLSSISAAERGDPPAITQIFEIGTKQAMDSGSFVPVEEHIPSDVVEVDSLLDPVRNYYRTDGVLYSMPFNSSNPILCYNADAFREAGLDPSDPPETFDAVQRAAERLVESGVTEYGLTFANYSWFVEQWFAEQDQQLVDRRNGRDGMATETYLDSDAGRRIFEWWAELDRTDLYYNPGIEARGAAKDVFHDETAAMLIGSTSSLAGIRSGAEESGFEMGTGYFPVPEDRTGVLVGGGSLWLADAIPREQQAAAAEFIGWLAQPEQQVRWHKETGYFPVHERAVTLLERDGWFEANSHFATAFDQLRETRDTVATSGARIGPFDTVRTMIAEAYEEMSDGQPVGDSLDRLTRKVERQLESYRNES